MAMISATVLVYFTVHVHTRSLMPTYILYNNAVRLTYLVLYNCMFCVCHTKSGQEYLHTTSPNPPKPKPNQTPNRSRYDRNSYQGELTPTGEVTPPSPGDDVLKQVLRGCQSAGEKGACGAPADRAVPRRDQGWGPNRWNWSWLRQPRRTCFNTSSPGTGAFPRNIIVQRGDPHQSDLPSRCVNSPCCHCFNRKKTTVRATTIVRHYSVVGWSAKKRWRA